MNSKKPTPEEFNASLREGLFFDIWNTWHEPIRRPYTIQSLSSFSSALKERADQHDFPIGKGFSMEELLVYAYYLGETMVRNLPDASWQLDEEAAGKNMVVIKRKDEALLKNLPYNTVYKVARGFIQDLPSVVESLRYTASQLDMITGLPLNRTMVFPNGVRVTALEQPIMGYDSDVKGFGFYS